MLPRLEQLGHAHFGAASTPHSPTLRRRRDPRRADPPTGRPTLSCWSPGPTAAGASFEAITRDPGRRHPGAAALLREGSWPATLVEDGAARSTGTPGLIYLDDLTDRPTSRR